MQIVKKMKTEDILMLIIVVLIVVIVIYWLYKSMRKPVNREEFGTGSTRNKFIKWLFGG
jgi:uncharacterized membrane protein